MAQNVFDLIVDPVNPQTVYAATDAGVFKSTDGGASWTSIRPSPFTVNTLAIDPSNPQTVYAGGDERFGVYKTTDGGASWSFILYPSGLVGDDIAVNALAMDPSNPQILYAGTDGRRDFGGLFKSTDGGASWTPSNTGLIDRRPVNTLAIDPSNPQTLYAGTNSNIFDFGGLFKSTDGGASWAPSNTGLTDPTMQRPAVFVRALAIDRTDPETLYAGTNAGIFKTTDGGANWIATNNGLTGLPSTRALAVDPSNPDILYAGITGGPFKSTDGGASWTPSNNGLRPSSVNPLAVDPSDPATLYAGSYKTTNGGASWTLNLINPFSLAIDPSDPATLYAGTSVIFKTTDGGANWTASNNGLPGRPLRALAVDPSNPQTIYAGTDRDGVFKSTDGGASWTDSSTGLLSSFIVGVNALAIDPANTATLYAGTGETFPNNGRIFKSIDGGTSWTASNISLPDVYVNGLSSVTALAIDRSNGAILYAGTFGGVFKSTDGGANWTASNTGLTNLFISALVIDPSNPTTLYAGTGDGVFKSTDGGANWTASNIGLPDYPGVNTLVIAPSDPTVLYAGSDGAGVFKSTDAGATWQPTGAVLEGAAQPPTGNLAVNEGGIVNNASFAPSPAAVAPGSIAAVFGTNLNDGSQVLSSSFGSDGRLVTTLGGASVTVGGFPAPLYYSTRGQLGIQIPLEVAGQTSATIQVQVGERTSSSRTLALANFAPGIFTLSQDGRGSAAVLHEDGATPVTSESPARPGEIVVLFATGLGAVTPPLATGEPSTGNEAVTPAFITIDDLNAEVLFSGAAPGFVGLYQLDGRQERFSFCQQAIDRFAELFQGASLNYLCHLNPATRENPPTDDHCRICLGQTSLYIFINII